MSRGLGGLIARQRQAKHLSQRELAAAADISNATIARLESGHTARLAPDLLARIATALDARLSDYYLLAGYPLPDEQPELETYLRSRYRLDDQAIERIRTIIKSRGEAPGEPRKEVEP